MIRAWLYIRCFHSRLYIWEAALRPVPSVKRNELTIIEVN